MLLVTKNNTANSFPTERFICVTAWPGNKIQRRATIRKSGDRSMLLVAKNT